jgi:hypothetical protein
MALEQVAPIANRLKIGYDQLIAVNSVLSRSGMSGVKGLMSFSNIMLAVTTATEDAQREATELGIVWSAEGVQAMGFANWISHVADRLKAADTAGTDVAKSLTKMGLSAREMGVISQLTKDVDVLNGTLKQMGEGIDELPVRWSQRQGDIDFQARRLEVTLNEVWKSIGNGMIEGIGGGTDELNSIVDGVRSGLVDAADAGKNLGVTLKSLVQWTASKDGLPAAVSAVSSLTSALFTLLRPMVWIIDKAAALGKWNAEHVTGPAYWAVKDWYDTSTQQAVPDTPENRAKGKAFSRETSGMRNKQAWRAEERAITGSGPLGGPEGPKWASPQAALMYGGLDAYREAVGGLAPGTLAAEMAKPTTPPVPAPQAPKDVSQLKLQVEQLLKLQIDQKGNVKGGKSTGKIAGSGAADPRGIDINASYRFMVIGAGEGENTVRPMPINVLMGHIR